MKHFKSTFFFNGGIALIFGFILATSSPAPLIYRPGEGWQVEGKDTVEETSKEQLDKGARYEKQGRLEEASNAYHALVRTWPLSPNAAEGQYRYAETLYKLYDFQRSFKEFQKCIEKYPDTEHFEEILKRQYDIGCLFLAGERQKIWKIPTLPSMDKTVEMFEKVIKNGPYSSVAPMSQLKIGFAREKQHQWEGAVKAYKELIRKYPSSNLADDAQFQIGYAYMQASREADYDQTATNRAVTALEDFITKYPKSEKVEQAREDIARLKHEQGRGYMTIAQFYDSKKNYDAALVYYNNVIQKYPDTDIAKRAVVRAEEIRKLMFESMNPAMDKPGKPAAAAPASKEEPRQAAAAHGKDGVQGTDKERTQGMGGAKPEEAPANPKPQETTPEASPPLPSTPPTETVSSPLPPTPSSKEEKKVAPEGPSVDDEVPPPYNPKN